MTQQSTVTINGFVGADPASFGREGSSPACSFRVGCTPRYYNSSSGQWCDRPTTWLTVKAFRSLALNVMSSVHKGDPVVVTGTLASEEWTKDGIKHVKMVMEATSVGHDLGLGTSSFQRVKPGGAASEQHQAEQDIGADPYRGGDADGASDADSANAAPASSGGSMGGDAQNARGGAMQSAEVQADEFDSQPDDYGQQ